MILYEDEEEDGQSILKTIFGKTDNDTDDEEDFDSDEEYEENVDDEDEDDDDDDDDEDEEDEDNDDGGVVDDHPISSWANEIKRRLGLAFGKVGNADRDTIADGIKSELTFIQLEMKLHRNESGVYEFYQKMYDSFQKISKNPDIDDPEIAYFILLRYLSKDSFLSFVWENDKLIIQERIGEANQPSRNAMKLLISNFREMLFTAGVKPYDLLSEILTGDS